MQVTASPLRDAWKRAASVYPEFTTEPDALVFSQNHPICVASLGPADGSGWNYAGPFGFVFNAAQGR
jgi:hypothetical protein